MYFSILYLLPRHLVNVDPGQSANGVTQNGDHQLQVESILE